MTVDEHRQVAELYFINYNHTVIAIKQTATFAKWEAHLRDKRARTLITSRLARLAYGLADDVKAVGGGGDKRTQACDIATARRLAKEWNTDYD